MSAHLVHSTRGAEVLSGLRRRRRRQPAILLLLLLELLLLLLVEVVETRVGRGGGRGAGRRVRALQIWNPEMIRIEMRCGNGIVGRLWGSLTVVVPNDGERSRHGRRRLVAPRMVLLLVAAGSVGTATARTGMDRGGGGGGDRGRGFGAGAAALAHEGDKVREVVPVVAAPRVRTHVVRRGRVPVLVVLGGGGGGSGGRVRVHVVRGVDRVVRGRVVVVVVGGGRWELRREACGEDNRVVRQIIRIILLCI